MLYDSFEDFCKVVNKDFEMLVFDFDGTLCTAKYSEDCLCGIQLTSQDLEVRDTFNSPYVNGLVKPSLIGR